MEQKVTKLLEHARMNCQFYSAYGITDNCIDDFPILTKESIVNNTKKIFARNVKLKTQSNIVRSYTSGTNGIPLSVYWHKNEYLRSMLELWRRRYEYYGITTKSKKVSFNYKINHSDNFSKTEYDLDFNKQALYDRTQFMSVYEMILDFEPEWLYIKPHIFKLFYEEMRARDLAFPSSIRYVEFVGENIDFNEEERIRKDLQIHVANLYGSEEMNGIAYECPSHHMHILSSNVFVEVQNRDDEQDIRQYGTGRILLTNLNNYFMPLIRYAQGDFVCIERLSQKCSCGSNEPILSHIYGRDNEIICCDGKFITSALLSEIMNDINYSMSYPIAKYRFLFSENTAQMDLTIQVREDFRNWKEAIAERCYSILRSKLYSVDIKIRFENIEDDGNEKNKILSIVP